MLNPFSKGCPWQLLSAAFAEVASGVQVRQVLLQPEQVGENGRENRH